MESLTVQVVYEKGILKPKKKLNLPEHSGARRAFEEFANQESSLLSPVIVLAELIFTIENKPIQADFDDILDAVRIVPTWNLSILITSRPCGCGI